MIDIQSFYRSIQDKYLLLESQGFSFVNTHKTSLVERVLNKTLRSNNREQNTSNSLSKSYSEKKDVDIIIPVYGKSELLIQCIDNLEKSKGIKPHITIVDNGCDAKIIDAIKSNELILNIIQNEKNLGYGQACDQGIKSLNSNYCVLLNSDALVEPIAIRELIDTLEYNDNISIASSICLNSNGLLQEFGRVLMSDGHTLGISENMPKEHILNDQLKQVPFTSFACIALNIDDYIKVGGFDKQFSPAYSEDVDLCIRIWQASKAVVVNSNSIVNHSEGVSSSELNDIEAIKQRNIDNLLVKHKDLLAAFIKDVDIQNYPHEINSLFGIFFERKILVFVNENIDSNALESITKISKNDWILNSIYILSNIDLTNINEFVANGVEVVKTEDESTSHHFLRNHIGYFESIIINFDAAMDPLLEMIFTTQAFAKYEIKLNQDN